MALSDYVLRWLTVPSVLVALALPQALRSQDLCIPEAFGVPGALWNQPPRWWAAGTSLTFPAEMDRLDDPRWRGAVSQVLNNGEAEFRALYKGGNLYLSWQAKADGVLNVGSNPDRVLLGIKQASGNPVVIDLRLNSTSQPLNAASVVSFVAYQWNPGTLGWDNIPATTPGWINSTARAWTRLSGTNFSWAVQLVIPKNSTTGLSGGLVLASSFQMWYALLVVAPDGSVPEYRWGTGAGTIRQSSGLLLLPKGNVTWGSVTLGASTCPANVALDPLQIGTDGADDNIQFTPTSAGSNSFINEFHARPTNVGTTVITKNSIEGRFFLANWGSQVPLSTSLWEEITPSTIPKNNDDINPPNTAQSTLPRNDIHFAWKVPDADRCRFGDTSSSCANTLLKFPHQCMLVQLSSSSSSLAFRNQSAYRNMQFKSLSRLSDIAGISVKGLAPIPDGRATRDVYLYVETRNLPAKVAPVTKSTETIVVPGKDTMIIVRRDTTFNLEWGAVRAAEGDTLIVPTKDTMVLPARDNVERLTKVRSAAQTGRLTSEDVDALVPTYRVHAYHTTGDTLFIDGAKHAVLEPQTSFGYYVGHDGDIIGWRHELKGANLIRLAPNFYRIAVPNNGVAIVTTTIEALEPRPLALSLHAGVSLPHGTFNGAYDPGLGFTIDGKRQVNSTFAIIGLLGYHRFEGAGANADLDLYHASAGLEALLTSGRVTLLAEAGGGLYHFSPGSTDPGAHAGIGLELDVSPAVVLGISYRAHTVFTSGSNTTFSSIQAGARLRF
jgi:hypothetical protein